MLDTYIIFHGQLLTAFLTSFPISQWSSWPSKIISQAVAAGIAIKIEFSFLSLYFEFCNFLVSYIIYVLFVYICSYSPPLSHSLSLYIYVYIFCEKKKKERAVQNGHYGGWGVVDVEWNILNVASMIHHTN